MPRLTAGTAASAARLPPLVPENKQEPTDRDGANTCPQGYVDLLLLFDRKFDWAEFDCGCVFGVAESTVYQAETAGHDQYDADELCGFHVDMLLR